MSLQVRLLIEPSLTLRAVDHLSAHIGQAALPQSLGAELRMIFCREGEVRGQVKCPVEVELSLLEVIL